MSDTTGEAPLDVAARFATEDEARQAVERLTLRGIGALSERGDDANGPFAVLVVPGETHRACEVLGIAADRPAEPPPSRRPQLLWVLVVFGAALIILPALAFLLSFKLSGG